MLNNLTGATSKDTLLQKSNESIEDDDELTLSIISACENSTVEPARIDSIRKKEMEQDLNECCDLFSNDESDSDEFSDDEDVPKTAWERKLQHDLEEAKRAIKQNQRLCKNQAIWPKNNNMTKNDVEIIYLKEIANPFKNLIVGEVSGVTIVHEAPENKEKPDL